VAGAPLTLLPAQHIYQDAVAKENAYQKQSNFLIAERQLQSTPPLMPAVAAAALSDTQYRQALNKLDTYRTKALQVSKQCTCVPARHSCRGR
jgi:hypothetical protein